MTPTMKYIPCKIYVEDPASVWLSVYGKRLPGTNVRDPSPGVEGQGDWPRSCVRVPRRCAWSPASAARLHVHHLGVNMNIR